MLIQKIYFIKKEAPTQVFSSEFCEIFKNIFFAEHLRATVSGRGLAPDFISKKKLFKSKKLSIQVELRTFSTYTTITTAGKIKFSIKDFFRKCDQIRRKLRIWSHLLKKSLMENFIFLCNVYFSTTVNY